MPEVNRRTRGMCASIFNHARCSLIILLALGISGCGSTSLHTSIVEECRSYADRPFSSLSPWNTPLHQGENYNDIQSEQFRVDGGARINSTIWSHPVYIASQSDPARNIYLKGAGSPSFNFKVPNGVRPDKSKDGHLHVIDLWRCQVLEMWQAQVLSSGNIVASAAVINSLTDDGVYKGWHGVRAYGGSAIAGLIRRQDLVNGIKHALAVAVRPKALNRRNDTTGLSYIWPASSSDGGAGQSYGTSGNLYMGSSLALPPSLMPNIGRALTIEEMYIWEAFKEYGAIIVDTGDGNLILYAEPAASDLLENVKWDFLDHLARNVQRIIRDGG